MRRDIRSEFPSFGAFACPNSALIAFLRAWFPVEGIPSFRGVSLPKGLAHPYSSPAAMVADPAGGAIR